jgi:Na+-transporting NADH:ubiquinone oxidoreductase subunit NqrB
MNWKLIFALSLFGLAMGLATVFVIPTSVEPFFWLPIFMLCAFLIAKNAPGKPFLHGLMVGIVNACG